MCLYLLQGEGGVRVGHLLQCLHSSSVLFHVKLAGHLHEGGVPSHIKPLLPSQSAGYKQPPPGAVWTKIKYYAYL